MDDGFYNVLSAIAGRGGLSPASVPAASGEAPTVLRALREEKPKWLTEADGLLRCTERGYEALCREAHARAKPDVDLDVVEAYRRIAAGRGPAKRELDQVYATAESALDRAARLVARGDTQRGLCLLGDDDLTSVALALVGVSRKVTVVEIDAELASLIERAAEELGAERVVVRRDLRDPVPAALRGRFGAVFTDPPYAIEGFRLFVGRATELLRDDGRLVVSFGQSRRSVERGLEKQRALVELGYFIEEVVPRAVRYEGAESIGASSALYFCRRTPKARAPSATRAEGDLYTSRSPRKRG